LMMRRPPAAAALLSTLTLQIGALQTQSLVELATEPLSFTRLVDVIYSNDVSRQGAAHNEVVSLCASNGLWSRQALKTHGNNPGSRSNNSGNGEFAFALVLNAPDNKSVGVFAEAFDAIRRFHPQSSIVVVDNASPLTQSQQVLDFLQNEPNTLYVREDEGSSGFEVGGYSAALRAARKHHWNVSGWVFLQAASVLLQPLPLRSMPCKLMSFFRMGRRTGYSNIVPCGLPEFNQADYEAFHRNLQSNRDMEAIDKNVEWWKFEFQRLKHEFPDWGQYEQRVCEAPYMAPMHQFIIATAEGMEGLEKLGYFSIRPALKFESNVMEQFSGIFFEALDSDNESCFIDKERHVGNQGKGAGTGTYIHKQHSGGWRQGFFSAFLYFISVADKNRDTFVNGEEIASSKADRPEQFHEALGKLCEAFAKSDPFHGRFEDRVAPK